MNSMFKSNNVSLLLLVISFSCFILYLLNSLVNFQPIVLLSIMLFSILGAIFTIDSNDTTYKKNILIFITILYFISIPLILVFKLIFKWIKLLNHIPDSQYPIRSWILIMYKIYILISLSMLLLYLL